MKKLLLASSILLSTALPAECILECNSNECYTAPYYDSECSCGLFLSGQFLYWYACEEGLSYALKAQTIVQTTRPAGDPTWNLSPVNYKYIGVSWDPGLRLGFGAKSVCDGWDYSFYWTYYQNKSKSSVSVPQFDAVLPVVGEDALINPWSSPTVNIAAFFTDITGKWRFRVNYVDFQLGRRYWLSPCFTLRPFAGARGGWTKTTLRLNSTHEDAVNQIDMPTTLSSFFYKDFFRNRFWGAGLLAGLEPTWHFNSFLSLFGGIDASLLWGKYKIKKKENYQITGVSPTTGALIEETDYQVAPTSNFFSMQPILDLTVGFRFDANFCCDRYHFALDVGWEHHIWWNQITRYQATGIEQLPLFVNNNTLIQFQTGYTENVHDVNFGGGVVGIRFDF